ncbi:MAG: hypothetical protein HIU90_08435 [Proteobacteria bacterium]|nr:hypothetical protein [Pseudomonadota bacterium]
MTRWAWLRVRRGFVLQNDGRAFAAGDLMRVPAGEAAGYRHNTSPARPWLPVRLAYSITRTARLIWQAMGETSAARRRAAQRRRRAAAAVRRRATLVKVVRR